MIRKNNQLKTAVVVFLGMLLGFTLLKISSSMIEARSFSSTSNRAVEPTITPTIEVLPTITMDLAAEYLIVGIKEDETLDLRAMPGTDQEIVGSLPFGTTGIEPSGEAITKDGNTWIQVVHRDVSGWVEFDFLAGQSGELPEELVTLSHRITTLLKNRDYASLVPYIDPEICLRFSPYYYLNPQDRIFCPEDLAEISSEEIFLWGQYDGTGNPINLSFGEYHDQFVYDQDYFQAPFVGLNREVGTGNSINNISEIHPGGMMVEYHFPGIDPKYGGLDWRSLRLVFINQDGIWYLTAIVHGEWTI